MTVLWFLRGKGPEEQHVPFFWISADYLLWLRVHAKQGEDHDS